jgi:hypothetical protein
MPVFLVGLAFGGVGGFVAADGVGSASKILKYAVIVAGAWLAMRALREVG